MNWTPNSLRWFETLLFERYGQDFEVSEKSGVIVLNHKGSTRTLRFDCQQNIFFRTGSDFGCSKWRASVEGYQAPIKDEIPAPSGCELPAPLVEYDKIGATVHYDIPGLVYWVLNRMEEVECSRLDCHGRFPPTSAHAFRNGYLDRPIVDEWLIILAQVIKCVWPQLVFKKQKFEVKVSHDVDRPSQYAFQPWKSIARMMGGHLLKRNDLRAFVTAPWVKLNTHKSLHSADPFNTFEWLMDVSEENGLKSAFYFICGRTDPAHDADYEPEHPVIRNLMRRIYERGHEIGLHPSYGTFNRPDLMSAEAERLKRICAEEGILQKSWGGRMHYLRWEQPTTLRAWASAGMDYDSTMGYADQPGFRCGTCHEYPAFDPSKDECLPLRIRPLLVMDNAKLIKTLTEIGSAEEDKSEIGVLKERSKLVKGAFTLLWHNSSLTNEIDFRVFLNAVADRWPRC